MQDAEKPKDMKIGNYKELIVWQKSIKLVKEIYEICKQLPKSEEYGLCSQIKRASISIPSNIAEGYRRQGTKEYIHFLGIAAGSAAEVETQLIIVNELYQNIDTKTAEGIVVEIQKMLYVMIKKLK